MRHIWFAIPAYTGTIHIQTMRSIIADMISFADRGDRVTLYDESGNAMIGDSRALIVAKFLASDATDLIFIDWDVFWQAGALLRLVDAPVECAAAVYPQRLDPLGFTIRWLDRPELWADPKTGLLEVEGVPTGCVRLSRTMLQRMVDEYPKTEFECSLAPNSTAWALFDPWREGRLKYGEDFSFFKRWQAIDGQVWVDPEIQMGHIGFKSFVGSLGDWLRNRMAAENKDTA